MYRSGEDEDQSLYSLTLQVVSPGDTVGFTEAAKCQAIKKAFNDASKSKLSVLLIDNLERLVGE